LSLAEWNSVLAVNLTGYFLCAQAFGRQMRAHRSGSLVHVSSIAGSHAQGQSGAYSVKQGRRDHAVAQTRQRMGAARHPQQRPSVPAW